MLASYVPFILSALWALFPLVNIAQGNAAEVAMAKRSAPEAKLSAEAIRFRDMLAKYQPMPSEELFIADLENVDNSALFEVRIDIPDLGQVQVTAVLFDAYSHEVAPVYADWLDHYARTLKRYPLAHIRIEAHTDSMGSESSNQVLSELRAMEVKNQLVQRGVSESRIRSIGLGERHPVAPNDEVEGRRKNRRVEFLNYFPVERRWASE